MTNPFLSIDQKIVGDIYTSTEVMDNLTILCDDFGSRFGGTVGEKQAADFIQKKLESYGLQNVHLEPVEYIGWRRGSVQLELLSPIKRPMDCITLPHAPAANLRGSLVDLGDGAPADFDKRADEIKGKIVMCTSHPSPKGSKRWIHRNEKYGRALMAGATGFIFVNHYPAYGPATGGIGEEGEALIPGISVSYEDGMYLRRLLKRYGDVQIHLTSTDVCEPMISWNVIGELPGNSPSPQIVMLGSHYDGHDISQGAQDPASGAVAVMEAARALAAYAPNLSHTVRFALWGIEEIGLIGSIDYVKKHLNELDDYRFYLNMDSAGAIALDSKGVVFNEWADLEPLFKQWGREMGHEFGLSQSVNAHSDHYPFLKEGVPTAGMGNVSKNLEGRGYGHTRYDTLDKVNLTSLREAAVLAARLALRIASTGEWPVSRRSKETVEKLLDSPEYREEEALFAKLTAFYQERRKK